MHFEFLESVNRGQDHVRVEVDIRILHAVQREVIERAPLACDSDVLRCARPTLALILLTGAGEPIAHVGTERRKLEEVASVERHLDDALILDDRSDRRVFRRDECCSALHFDGLAHVSNLQSEIDARRKLNLQFDVILRNRAETRQFDLDVVFARLQNREVVNSRFVADCRTNLVRRRIGHRHHSAWNDGTACITNHTADGPVGLGQRR